MLTGGNNIGRIGNLQSLEKHPGSYEIAHVKDANGNSFSTRLSNVLVIGDGKTPAISVPKGDGLRLTLIQERDARLGDEKSVASDEE
jgi:small subunit ribosomal protein S4e